MKINQPTAIALAAGAVVLAGGVIWWTVNSNIPIPPPPIQAGISAPTGAKPVVTPLNTTPGMSLSPGGMSPGNPSPGGMSPTPGGMSPGSPMPSPGR